MRNRIIRYVLALALAMVLSHPPRRLAQAAPQRAGRLERVGDVNLVYVQGDAYEMGLQQGALLRTELRGLVQDYLYDYLIAHSSPLHFWFLFQARLLDDGLPDSLRQEMEGIADGAGLSYQDVLLLNVVPDLEAMTRKAPSWDLFPALFSSQGVPSVRASSGDAFAGWGRATSEGELLVGHNLNCVDSDLLRRYLVVLVRQPSAGNGFVSLGLMGTVGVWAGMNEEKIVVALSSSPSVDGAVNGQPLPFLLRQVLQGSGNLTEAENLLLSARRFYGGNVILGDGKVPQGVALELSAHRHALFETDVAGDLLLRTNHFLDPELAMTQPLVLSPEQMAASVARLERLQGVLEYNRGWIGTDKALDILGNMDQVPADGIEGVGPLQTVLLNPGRLSLWIALGDARVATRASYVRLDFAAELLGSR